MSGWLASATPASEPVPGTTLSTPGGKPALERDLAEPQRRHRRFARRLQHDGAAGGERRRDAARADLNRIVPRHDLRRHADRLAHRVVEEAGAERNRVAHDLVGDAGEELEVARRDLDVGARLAQRLAVVAALERRQLLGALAQRLRDPDHDAAALGRRGAAPGLRLERARARLPRRDRRPPSSPWRPWRARSPVDGSIDLERAAVGRVDALAVDDQLFDDAWSVAIESILARRCQRRAVVRTRSIRRLDQARCRLTPARRSIALARALPRIVRGGTPAGRSWRQGRPVDGSKRDAGRSRPRACCLISIRLSDDRRRPRR